MSLSVKVMLGKDLFARLSQSVGSTWSTLVFLISEHWLAKTELNSSAFSLKSASNKFVFMKKEGMQGIFLPVKKLFKIDQ